jgi:hypothetical protein
LFVDGDHIELYVEGIRDTDLGASIDKLSFLANVPSEWNFGNQLSILYPLRGLENVNYFDARPDHNDSERILLGGPTALMDLVTASREHLDPRTSDNLFKAVDTVVENILGTSLLVAEQKTADGVIDKLLLPLITSHLTEIFGAMRKETDFGISLKASMIGRFTPYVTTAAMLASHFALGNVSPEAWALYVGLNAQTSAVAFLDAVEKCVFAPHVISDAMFATKLAKLEKSDKPVVIVSGKAHSDMLKKMLQVLSQPRPN